MTDKKRYVRYLVLLLILLAVALHSLFTHLKIVSWEEPLSVQIIPINGDGTKTTADYINALQAEHFEDISGFIQREAERYGMGDDPKIAIRLAEEIFSRPPKLSDDRNILSNLYWTTAFRIWANWSLIGAGQNADIDLFIVFFDPAKYSHVGHSVGLEKGMIGLVNVYANNRYQAPNNVVIAHELLHVLGATDKYHRQNNFPIFPTGFAEPDKVPLYPQEKAEIMGGRIPLLPFKAVIPNSLDQVVIGEITALELHWEPLIL